MMKKVDNLYHSLSKTDPTVDDVEYRIIRNFYRDTINGSFFRNNLEVPEKSHSSKYDTMRKIDYRKYLIIEIKDTFYNKLEFLIIDKNLSDLSRLLIHYERSTCSLDMCYIGKNASKMTAKDIILFLEDILELPVSECISMNSDAWLSVDLKICEDVIKDTAYLDKFLRIRKMSVSRHVCVEHRSYNSDVFHISYDQYKVFDAPDPLYDLLFIES